MTPNYKENYDCLKLIFLKIYLKLFIGHFIQILINIHYNINQQKIDKYIISSAREGNMKS